MDIPDAATTLSRQDLYELVWSEPMTRLAVRFALSDRGLAKICQRMRIPTPGRGYWAKLQHGRRVRRTPLPPGRSSDTEEIVLGRKSQDTAKPPANPVHPLIMRERDLDMQVRVQTNLSEAPPVW